MMQNNSTIVNISNRDTENSLSFDNKSIAAHLGAPARASARLVMGNFQESPWLEFGDVIVGEQHTGTLLVENMSTSKGVAVLVVEKVPSSFTVSDFELRLSPGESKSIIVTWTPTEVGGFRGYIAMKAAGRFSIRTNLYGTVLPKVCRWIYVSPAGCVAAKLISAFSCV
jgi:hypothetical protein